METKFSRLVWKNFPSAKLSKISSIAAGKASSVSLTWWHSNLAISTKRKQANDRRHEMKYLRQGQQIRTTADGTRMTT